MIPEAPAQGRAVRWQACCHSWQKRRDLVFHQMSRVGGEDGVAHELVGALVPGESAEVPERGVRRVQQSRLHQRVGANVGDELDADLLEWRAAVAERILDDPLRK